jgi:hypothetical protein
MYRDGDKTRITTDDVRRGVDGRGRGNILGIGVATAIVALSAIWILRAMAG